MKSVSGLDYVQAFCQAAEEIFASVLAETPLRGKPKFQMGPAVALQEVNIGIGVTGDLAGHVNFGMDESTALAIAEVMMMEPVSCLDEMSISALSELANMVSGNARTYLNKNGVISDITPPSMMQGESITATWHHVRAMSIPLSIGPGTVTVTIGIRLKGA